MVFDDLTDEEMSALEEAAIKSFENMGSPEMTPVYHHKFQREGLHYISRTAYVLGDYQRIVTRKFDFFTYHVVKWIHGEEKINKIQKCIF